MQPAIKSIPAKKLIGKSIHMSFAGNKTFEVWKSFMPVRKEIKNTIGTDLYSVEVYPSSFFASVDPSALFEKWAAVEISSLENSNTGMKTLIIPAGLYAVFTYRGKSSEAASFYQNIFETWLPSSNYILADRPHFAVMGDTYKNEDPSSEEEIWIPINGK